MKAIVCRDTNEVSNDYQEYLKTRHWQIVKYEYRKHHKYQCVMCLEKDVRLELHHLHYETLGREKDEDLTYLCYKCHNIISKRLEDKKKTNYILKELKNFEYEY